MKTPTRRLLGAVVLLGAASACDTTPTGPGALPDLPSADLAIQGLVGAAAAVTPDDFDYEIIRVPALLGATGTIVQRANTRGDLVGLYFITDDQGRPGAWRGFLVRKGDFETIHVEGARYTRALGVNERGTVVGTYMNEDFTWHGFIYERGEYTTFDAPAGVRFGEDTWIWDIGATGAMTGGYLAEDGRYHGFVLEQGRFTDFMVPGSGMTEGLGINARGEVTGHFSYDGDPEGRMFGFIYKDGETTAILDYPGDDDWMSCAMGLGLHGEAVGHVGGTFPDGVYGYLWQKGEFRGLIMVPGSRQTFPTAVAPNGVIAGYAILAGGERVGFVARPKG